LAFKLVYYSQQDPQWKNDILGFGDSGDTIGYVGCALTSVAMLISGHGYTETPKTLNKKLKDVGGFASAGIRWGSVSQIYPQVSLKSFIPCTNSDAPLAQIDTAIAAGQPAIVMVDSTPAPGLLTHWAVLYARKGDDYLMLDPWPYQTDVTKETYLMPRYAQGNTLKRAIMHVILYECYTSGGPITTPDSTKTPAQPLPTPVPSTVEGPIPGGLNARVKADVTWGLNIRSSIDTSSMANVVASVPAGTYLLVLDSDGEGKIGGVNQWVRVRDAQGHEGFAAAWYLEKIAGSTPPPIMEPASTSGNEAPSPKPASTLSQPVEDKEALSVIVSSSVGPAGLRMRKQPSKGAALVAILSAGTYLTVLDDAVKAKSKIGKANQWILVRDEKKNRGYVAAEFVTLA
jgi:hypothetical protein